MGYNSISHIRLMLCNFGVTQKMIYDIIVIIIVVFPYLFLLGLEIYERTEYGKRREIKEYSEELKQLLIDVNYDYFRNTIECWCEIHHKKVVDNKLVPE